MCTRNHIAYRCGQEAAFALAAKIGRHVVSCIRRDTDRYGRMVAVCTAGGEDLSRWMIQRGHAIAFRKYSLAYVTDEDRAKAAKAGLWAGEFQRPEDFRRGGRIAGRSHRNPLVRKACMCPADLDAVGHRCGGRSAFSRAGGLTAVRGGRM